MINKQEILSVPIVVKYLFTGSRIICNPPPTDTDEDILVLVNSVQDMCQFLGEENFQLSGSCVKDKVKYNHNGFVSMKKEEVNFIITESEEFYKRFECATVIAKRFNLLNKDDRIELFQNILYNNYGIDHEIDKIINGEK